MDEFYQPEQEPPESGVQVAADPADFVPVEGFIEQLPETQPELPAFQVEQPVEQFVEPQPAEFSQQSVEQPLEPGDFVPAEGFTEQLPETQPELPAYQVEQPVEQFVEPQPAEFSQQSVEQPLEQPEPQPVFQPYNGGQLDTTTGDVYDSSGDYVANVQISPPDLQLFSAFAPQPVADLVQPAKLAQQSIEQTVTEPTTMEVWNDEAPNAHTTMNEEDLSQYDVPAQLDEPTPVDPDLIDGYITLPGSPQSENAQPDEFGDVYAADGTFVGNAFLNPEMTQPAAGETLPEGSTIDQTTGDILDQDGNVIGNLADSGTGYVDLGTANQGPREDVTVDDQGDIYDKDGNYVGNSADSFIDEYGNVFDAKGNYVGMTSPANANLASAATMQQQPGSVGNIIPRGGPGASGGGAGGSGGGSGLSISPKAPAQIPQASPTTTKTAAKVLVQQVKSGTALIKIYSDGSREVISNYYASTIASPVQTTAKMPTTVVTRPNTGLTGGGLKASAVNANLNEKDFLAALFGNLNKGVNGPGSGNVSMKGYNPSTQLTPSGQARVSGGRTAGSTAPVSTVNTLIAGSRPGQQGVAQVDSPQGDVMGGKLSSGAGGLAALAIGAVALFAIAS